MKVTAFSDIHMQFSDELLIEPTDLLVCAGDATHHGIDNELYSFIRWLGLQPAKHKVFVPGNHDFGCQKNEYMWKTYCREMNIHLETNGFLYIEDKALFCSAWTPYFYDWAFNGTDELEGEYKGPNLYNKWKCILECNIDLLVTHGPARGILDINRIGEHCGSIILAHLLNQKHSIKHHIFGHIHDSHGYTINNGIKSYNVSLDVQYYPQHDFTKFEI